MSTGSSTIATAEALQAAGRAAEARHWYRRALAERSEDPSALAGLARIELAAGRLAEGEAFAARAVAAAPHSPQLLSLHRQVGMTLFARGYWEEARPWLQRAAALEPWDGEIAHALARSTPRADLAPDIFDPVQGRTLRRYAPRESASYVYAIDVVGTCNLRCPTCPVGNSPAVDRPRGIMEPDLFARIVAKIKGECPAQSPEIWLFNWGEPLLHPELPRLIRMVKDAGLRCHLSSNLNIRRGLEEVIKAGADELKISLSGFMPETYGRTHVRGDVDLVKANMRRVRGWLDQHRVQTRVWVGHHLYRSNLHEMELVAQLCRELGFAHNPIQAFYMPLERLVDLLDGKPAAADSGILADLLYDPAARVASAMAQRSGAFDCELRFNQTVINFDGTVALCCTVYEPDNMLGISFLDHDFAEIEARKYRHPFCRTCMAHGLEYTRSELRPGTDASRNG